MKEVVIKVYMCGIDWQHELGQALGGNRVYASVEDLKQNRTCWKECGIVEVEVKLSKWIENQNLYGG